MATSTSRRSLRRAGAVALGIAALIGSLVAFPAAAIAAPTTTVRGTVTVAGEPVADVPVGTWSPTEGVVATATTDAQGRFVLHSPSGVSVVAYAGAKPSAAKAVFAVGTEHLVRGVIGASAPKHLAGALQQLVARALPGRLGGGHALRFRLQEAGRFTASSPVLGTEADTTGEIDVEHANGYYSPEYSATPEGVVTSGWLVPGRYHLVWNGKALLERTWVTVRAGETVTAATPKSGFSTGATVRLHVSSAGWPVPEGVPSVQLVGGVTDDGPSTDDTGTIVVHGVAPGTYRYIVGQFFDDPDEGLEGPPSSDDYLPRTVSVTVGANATSVDADVALTPASRISGTIVAPSGTTTTVSVEDAAGNVVRQGSVLRGASPSPACRAGPIGSSASTRTGIATTSRPSRCRPPPPCPAHRPRSPGR